MQCHKNLIDCRFVCSLPLINIFTDDGKINMNGGRFAGLMRFDAREAIEVALKEMVCAHSYGKVHSVFFCFAHYDIVCIGIFFW